MEETQKCITDSVRALSAWKRETQADLGEVLGISPVSVAQRLNGRLKWSLEDVQRLCSHYGVTYDQLTRGPGYWLTFSGVTAPPGDTVRYLASDQLAA